MRVRRSKYSSFIIIIVIVDDNDVVAAAVVAAAVDFSRPLTLPTRPNCKHKRKEEANNQAGQGHLPE